MKRSDESSGDLHDTDKDTILRRDFMYANVKTTTAI